MKNIGLRRNNFLSRNKRSQWMEFIFDDGNVQAKEADILTFCGFRADTWVRWSGQMSYASLNEGSDPTRWCISADVFGKNFSYKRWRVFSFEDTALWWTPTKFSCWMGFNSDLSQWIRQPICWHRRRVFYVSWRDCLASHLEIGDWQYCKPF